MSIVVKSDRLVEGDVFVLPVFTVGAGSPRPSIMGAVDRSALGIGGTRGADPAIAPLQIILPFLCDLQKSQDSQDPFPPFLAALHSLLEQGFNLQQSFQLLDANSQQALVNLLGSEHTLTRFFQLSNNLTLASEALLQIAKENLQDRKMQNFGMQLLNFLRKSSGSSHVREQSQQVIKNFQNQSTFYAVQNVYHTVTDQGFFVALMGGVAAGKWMEAQSASWLLHRGAPQWLGRLAGSSLGFGTEVTSFTTLSMGLDSNWIKGSFAEQWLGNAIQFSAFKLANIFVGSACKPIFDFVAERGYLPWAGFLQSLFQHVTGTANLFLSHEVLAKLGLAPHLPTQNNLLNAFSQNAAMLLGGNILATAWPMQLSAPLQAEPCHIAQAQPVISSLPRDLLMLITNNRSLGRLEMTKLRFGMTNNPEFLERWKPQWALAEGFEGGVKNKAFIPHIFMQQAHAWHELVKGQLTRSVRKTSNAYEIRNGVAIVVGEKIGNSNFTFEKFLGEGDESRVFLASDLQGQKIVLKFAKSDQNEKLLLEEARLMQALPKNIGPVLIDVYDINMGNVVFKTYAYRYLPGIDLHVLLNSVFVNITKELSLADRLKLWLAIADQVHALHEAGYAHLDLYPKNIFLPVEGRPLLLDLTGASKQLDLSGRVFVDHIHANLDYAAPELKVTKDYQVAFGFEFPNFRLMDIYSLGLILHEIISGSFYEPSGQGYARCLRDYVEGPQVIIDKLEAVINWATSTSLDQRAPNVDLLTSYVRGLLIELSK